MTVLIEAANYYQTRRHYTTEMRPYHRRGMKGASLCSGAIRTDVYDQAYHDDRGFTPVPISSLPLCKLCERKAAKESMEVPT